MTPKFDEQIATAYLADRPRRADGRLAKENDRQAFARGYYAATETAYGRGYEKGLLRGSQDKYGPTKALATAACAVGLAIIALCAIIASRELVKLNNKDLAPKAPTVVNEVKMPEPKVVVVQQQVPPITLRMDKQLLRARNNTTRPAKAVVK